MADLSNAELSVEGEYGDCLVCGESFHWEQLTNTAAGSYCEDHAPGEWVYRFHHGFAVRFMYRVKGSDDEADMGHDTALERDTSGDAL